jgi:hypothetical protein
VRQLSDKMVKIIYIILSLPKMLKLGAQLKFLAFATDFNSFGRKYIIYIFPTKNAKTSRTI